MSKYNFDLDLYSENSLSIIIDMLDTNSKVLEFGPAHGRLTKYMKEVMHCTVDIVEIDEESGKEASKYANKSFIGEEKGNIEKYLWLDELKDERYDYIIFADVLEHLYWPEKVLKKVKKLLKDKGSILLSVPNISHNSIIIDLINDEFKYNQTGLLDNTHIRFFTINSLRRMIKEASLEAIQEKATYCRVGENEILNSYNNVNNCIAKELIKREKGNVYQYVFEVKKLSKIIETQPLKFINIDKSLENELVVYIGDQNISEDRTIKKYIIGNDVNIKIDLSEYKNITDIRIDPLNKNCIIENLEVTTTINNEKQLVNIIASNSEIYYNNRYYFVTDDPHVFIDTSKYKIKDINIRFKIIDFKINNFDEILSSIRSLIVLDKKLKEKQKIISQKDNQINNLNVELMNTKSEICELKKIITNKYKQYEEDETRNIKQEKYLSNRKLYKIFRWINSLFKSE